MRQNHLHGNIIDDYTAYMFRYARKYGQTPLLVVQATYSESPIKGKEQMYYQVKFLP